MDDEVSCTNSAPVVLVTVSSSSLGSPRSVSPITPSSPHGLRGIKLFTAIGRRLGRSRRLRVEPEEDDDDASRSSTDSCDRSSGSSGGRSGRSKKSCGSKRSSFLQRRSSCSGSDTGLLYIHCTGSSGGSSSSSSSSSSSGSDTSSGHVPARNSPSPSSSLQNGISFKGVFRSLTRNSRSHSASRASSNVSNTDTRRVSDASGSDADKKNRSILRAPAAYTYVRGLSGLPTHRIRGRCPCVYLPPVVCCTTNFPPPASFRPP